jgi:hypothetical protein
MRLPRFRVRTLMVLVAALAVLIWGSMMGARSYAFCRLAKEYGANERGWREIADRPNQPGGREFRLRCVKYYAQLAGKYRRAMWCPWKPVASDPHAPGYDQWLEQERREKEAAPDRLPPPEKAARP